MGVPPNGWFMMENAIKMDDLGVLATLIIKLYLDNIPVLLLDSGFFFWSPKNPRIKQKPPEKCPTSLLFFFLVPNDGHYKIISGYWVDNIGLPC